CKVLSAKHLSVVVCWVALICMPHCCICYGIAATFAYFRSWGAELIAVFVDKDDVAVPNLGGRWVFGVGSVVVCASYGSSWTLLWFSSGVPPFGADLVADLPGGSFGLKLWLLGGFYLSGPLF
ncbi:hypothetical protein U1Q18_014397, partial [Sarracenia purpurea var. burkii]